MPAALLGQQDAVGFMGSDTYDETCEYRRARLDFVPVIQTDIRFALSALNSRINSVEKAIKGGDELVVATSYPNQAKRIANLLGFDLTEIVELGGSVEAAVYAIDRVDAIIDVVSSGRTLEENGLTPVIDNLGRLAIGTVWNRKIEGDYDV